MKNQVVLWCTVIGKIAGLIVAGSGAVGFLPDKFKWIGLIVVALSSIAKDALNLIADALDDGELNDSISKGIRLMLIASLAIFGLSACATTTGTPSAIEQGLPFARGLSSLACSATLQLAVSDEDRVDKANYVYSIAKCVRTLAGGTVPTREDLEAAINLWSPEKAHWASLSKSIGSIYESAYSQLKDNPKLAVEFIEALALGCEDAAGSAR